MRKTRRRSAGYFLVYLVLCLWAVVCLFPLYWVAITSLKGEWEIVKGPFYIPFGDFRPNLEAWTYVLTDPNSGLPRRYLNSAVVAVSSSLLTLLLAGFAVYGVTRFRPVLPWRGVALVLLAGAALIVAMLLVPTLRWLLPPLVGILAWRLSRTKYFVGGPKITGNGLLAAVLATRILPPVVVVVPVYLAATFVDTLDTRYALVFVYTAANLPVAVWLLYGVFGNLATEQEEAAQLDGAARFRVFFEIFLPMVAASVAATGLLIFILCWNEYLFAAFLTGSNAMTLPPWLGGQMSTHEAQASGDQQEWSRLSAATVLMVLPLLLLTVSAQRIISRTFLRRR